MKDDEVYCQLPKSLFCYKRYEGLSLNAKVVYTILKDLMRTSEWNGWTEENGDIILMCSYKHLAEVLGVGKSTAGRAFRELTECGLVEAVPVGNDGAQKIYLHQIEPVRTLAELKPFAQKDKRYRAMIARENSCLTCAADGTPRATDETGRVVDESARATSEPPRAIDEQNRAASESGCAVDGMPPVPPVAPSKSIYSKTESVRPVKENSKKWQQAKVIAMEEHVGCRGVRRLNPHLDLDPDGNPLPTKLPGEDTGAYLARCGYI